MFKSLVSAVLDFDPFHTYWCGLTPLGWCLSSLLYSGRNHGTQPKE